MAFEFHPASLLLLPPPFPPAFLLSGYSTPPFQVASVADSLYTAISSLRSAAVTPNSQARRVLCPTLFSTLPDTLNPVASQTILERQLRALTVDVHPIRTTEERDKTTCSAQPPRPPAEHKHCGRISPRLIPPPHQREEEHNQASWHKVCGFRPFSPSKAICFCGGNASALPHSCCCCCSSCCISAFCKPRNILGRTCSDSLRIERSHWHRPPRLGLTQRLRWLPLSSPPLEAVSDVANHFRGASTPIIDHGLFRRATPSHIRWGSCSQQAVDCLKYYCQADTPKYTRHTRHPPPQRKFSSANEPVSWGTAQDRAANRIISSPNHVTVLDDPSRASALRCRRLDSVGCNDSAITRPLSTRLFRPFPLTNIGNGTCLAF